MVLLATESRLCYKILSFDVLERLQSELFGVARRLTLLADHIVEAMTSDIYN
jgi:hypothetical protein